VTLLLLVLAAGLSVAWVRAPQTGGNTVVGEVTNGTPGGTVPDDLTVMLHTFSEMGTGAAPEETGTYTTTLTEERSFRFEDVPLQEGTTVVARVTYDGVTHVSEFATVEQGPISLPVTIYETTEDPADIVISQLHLFLNQMGERIQIGTYAVIGNTGNRTYIGTPFDGVRTTWSVQLPDGAENLMFEDAELGGRFLALEDGFADTRSLPPGDARFEVSFTYELPFDENMEIAQSFDVPVRAAVLVLPEGDWRLRGENIASESTLETQMGAALSYTAGPLSAGEPLAFTVVPRTSGDSSPSSGRTAQNGSSNSLAAGIAALVVAGVVVALMWRDGVHPGDDVHPRAPSPGPIPAEVRSQVETIAALDRDFDDGKVSKTAYRERRRSLKRRLHQTLSDQGR
jgi:hypothetical protein